MMQGAELDSAKASVGKHSVTTCWSTYFNKMKIVLWGSFIYDFQNYRYKNT